MTPAGSRPGRDERGQATVVIVGLTFVLALAVGVVIDATAAYLHRQDLNTLADGAALQGADRGATGEEIYTDGLGSGPLQVTPASARAAVADYLTQVGAYREHPGLRHQVSVSGDSIRVRLSSPVELPLTVPGAPTSPRIAAEGAAQVRLD